MWEIIAAVIGAAITGIVAMSREGQARQENYKFNEMSAENADKRTRALYNDISSPTAQKAQIEKAGLSPSLFYSGGVAGSSGMTGAQGGGGGNIAPNVYGISAEQIASIRNINADTKLKEAEANKTHEDTNATQIQNALNNIINAYKEEEATIDFATFTNETTGKPSSLFEIATECSNYEEFLEKVRAAANKEQRTDFLISTKNEAGQRRLREIYLNSEKYDTAISTLTSDKVSADFQVSLMNALQKLNYAKQSAKAMLQQLKTSVSTNELTEQQKEAWNNLIKKLERKAGTDTKDVLIVLAMLANNVATQWHAPTIQHQTRNNYITTNNNQ